MSPDDTSKTGATPAGNTTAETLQRNKAYQSLTAWLLLLVPATAGIAGDQWVKTWAFPGGVPGDPELMPYAGRQPGTMSPIIDHFLGFTTTVNRGAVFGFAQGHVSIFLAFSLVALAVILWVFATSGARNHAVHVALGLITAGAIGNLYDRAVYHGVRDMLRFYVSWYPYIFNVADVLLCVGVPLLMLCWIVEGYTQSKTGRGFPLEDKPA